MASAAYHRWVSAGRPLVPARPVRDVVDRMKLAYPRAAAKNLFSWYANEAHYQAVPPQDHTPFSATGWPGHSPEWWVFATDIMHRPDLGVDCTVLFKYWLSEAKAGRFPSLKYIIWQAKLYSVQNNWSAQSNSGHFDHIHLSFRTDYQNVSLGSWSLIPGGSTDDDMFFFQDEFQGAGRMNGLSYEYAPNLETLLKWKGAWPGVVEKKVKKADLLAGLYGSPTGNSAPIPAPGPSDGVTAEQARDIAREEISATSLIPGT